MPGRTGKIETDRRDGGKRLPFLRALLSEADTRLRALERKAAESGAASDVAAYLRELQRVGRPPDLSIVPRDHRDDSIDVRFLSYLSRTRQLPVLFSRHWPFDDERAKFLYVNALEDVHENRAAGVAWDSFLTIIERWLEGANEDDLSRGWGNSPVEQFVGAADDTGDFIQFGEMGNSVRRVYWELPYHNDTWETRQRNQLNYADLLLLARHLDAGALVEHTERGFINVEWLDSEAEGNRRWAEIEANYDEFVAEQQEQYMSDLAHEHGTDAETMERILARHGLLDDFNVEEGLTDRDVKEAIDGWIDAVAADHAKEQLDDLIRQGVANPKWHSVADVEARLKAWMQRDELELDPTTWAGDVRRLWHEYGYHELPAEMWDEGRVKRPRGVLLGEADTALRRAERRWKTEGSRASRIAYLHALLRTRHLDGEEWHELVLLEVCDFLGLRTPPPGTRTGKRYKNVAIHIGWRFNDPKQGLSFRAVGNDPGNYGRLYVEATYYTHGPSDPYFYRPWAFMLSRRHGADRHASTSEGYEGGTVYRPGRPKEFLDKLVALVEKDTAGLEGVRKAFEDVRKLVKGKWDAGGDSHWISEVDPATGRFYEGMLGGFDAVSQHHRFFIALYEDRGINAEPEMILRAATTFHRWPRVLLTEDEYSAFWNPSNTFVYRGAADLVKRLG